MSDYEHTQICYHCYIVIAHGLEPLPDHELCDKCKREEEWIKGIVIKALKEYSQTVLIKKCGG